MRVPAGRAVSQVPGDAAHDCADVGTHRLVRRCRRSCQCHELAESRGLVGDRIGQPGAQAGSSSGGQGRQRERSGRNPGDDGIPPVHVGQRSEELGAVIAGECRDLRRRPTISQQPLPEPTGARGAARPARDQTGERGRTGSLRVLSSCTRVRRAARSRHRHLAVDEQVEGGRTGLHGLDRRSATIGGIGRPGQPAAASVHTTARPANSTSMNWAAASRAPTARPGLARKLLVGDRVDLVTSLARQCFQCAGHHVEDLVDAEFLASKLVGQWDAADTQQAAPGESHEHE